VTLTVVLLDHILQPWRTLTSAVPACTDNRPFQTPALHPCTTINILPGSV